MKDDADVLVLNAVMLIAKGVVGHAGDERHFPDHDGGHLVISGQDCGPGEDLDLPYFGDGAQRGGKIVSNNGINPGPGERIDAGGTGSDALAGQAEQAAKELVVEALMVLVTVPSTPMSCPLLYVTSRKTTLINTCGLGRLRFETTWLTYAVVVSSPMTNNVRESWST